VLRGDWRWLAVGTGLLLVLTSTPYLVAAVAGREDLVRVGTFWFSRDFSQYLGAMRDAASSSSWLLFDRFSAEPHRPILMYVLYVALGKLAGALAVDPLALYYPLEVLARVGLALALYMFVAAFLSSGAERRLAFLLAAFTLGLGGWTIPLRAALQWLGWREALAWLPDSINPYLEMNSFGVFLSAPHLMLGLALTLAIPPLYLRAAAGRGWWPLALATLALGLIHPFNLPVVASVLAVDAAWQLARDGNRRPLAVLLPAVALATPILAYNAWVFTFDPFWSGTYGKQNLMPSPHPLGAWVDFGLVMLAAPLGLWLWRPWSRPEHRLLLLWIGLTFAWMYAPVQFQRRLGFGLQPGLSVAAAVALMAAQRWATRGPLGTRPVNYALALLAIPTPMLVFVSLVTSAAFNKPTAVYLWTRNEQAAAEWLAAHSTREDVVLSSIETGNGLVGWIPGRVVVGHIVATFDAPAKERIVKQFFSSTTPADERSRLLASSGATYVFVGPRERSLGAAGLDALPELRPLYRESGVTIYAVRRGS
jgi:hypothetical protein